MDFKDVVKGFNKLDKGIKWVIILLVLILISLWIKK